MPAPTALRATARLIASSSRPSSSRRHGVAALRAFSTSRPAQSDEARKDGPRDGGKEKEREKKKGEDEAQDTTVAGRSPFQAFVDVLKDEVRKNREWQDSVKQLQGEASKVQDSEAMRKAKEVYERARVSPNLSLSLSLSLSGSRCPALVVRGRAGTRQLPGGSSAPHRHLEHPIATWDLRPDRSRARELPEMAEGRSRSASRHRGRSTVQLLDVGRPTLGTVPLHLELQSDASETLSSGGGVAEGDRRISRDAVEDH